MSPVHVTYESKSGNKYWLGFFFFWWDMTNLVWN